MKEFIPYTEALALKELGFDEPCFSVWDTNDKSFSFHKYHEAVNGLIHPMAITAPTYSQAFRWFRDKYKIQGYIYSTTVRGNKNGKDFCDYCWHINGIDLTFMKTDARDMEGVTHEEAELSCLKKLIEIVKNK